MLYLLSIWTLKYKNGELDITTDDELFGSDGATTMRHN